MNMTYVQSGEVFYVMATMPQRLDDKEQYLFFFKIKRQPKQETSNYENKYYRVTNAGHTVVMTIAEWKHTAHKLLLIQHVYYLFFPSFINHVAEIELSKI